MSYGDQRFAAIYILNRISGDINKNILGTRITSMNIISWRHSLCCYICLCYIGLCYLVSCCYTDRMSITVIESNRDKHDGSKCLWSSRCTVLCIYNWCWRYCCVVTSWKHYCLVFSFYYGYRKTRGSNIDWHNSLKCLWNCRCTVLYILN